MKKTVLTLIILTTLLLPLVAAQNQSIFVDKYGNSRAYTTGATNGDLNLCSCQTFTDELFIENRGAYESTYRISTENEYAQIPVNRVTLAPGQSVNLAVNLAVPCDADLETQTYNVNVVDTFNQERVIQRSLTVNECQTIQATLYRDGNSTTAPCTPVPYTVQITNPAPYTETYTVTAEHRGDTTQVARTRIPSGETRNINTTVEYQCSVSGAQTTTFNIYAENTEQTLDLPATTDITQNYDYTVEDLRTGATCQESHTYHDYRITNNANFEETYDAELRGAQHFELRTTNITIPAGESQVLTVDETGLPTGAGNYELRITSRNGDITTAQTKNYTVENCQDAQIRFTYRSATYCAGENDVPVTITNTGTRETTYDINTNTTFEDIDFDDEVTLQPGENTSLDVTIETQPYGIDTRTLYVEAQATRSNIAETFSAAADFEVRDTYQCTILDTPEEVTGIKQRGETPVTVQNNGVQKAAYVLKTNNTDFVFEPSLIILEPGQTQTINLEYPINTSERIEELSVDINVQPSNQTYTRELTVEITDTPWHTRMYNYVATTPCAQILLALIILIALNLAAAGTYKEGRRDKDKTAAIVVAATLVLIVGAILLGTPNFLETQPRTTAENDTLTVQWYESTTETVYLPAFFEDPDNDTLTYNITDVENITTLITGDTLNLQAEQNFTGTRSATITATDVEGATTTANVALIVQPEPDMSFTTVYEANCDYVNLGLFIVFILTFIGYAKKPEQDGSETHKEEVQEERDEPDVIVERDIQAPTKQNTKKEIKAWLDEHNVEYKSRMRKAKLLELVESHVGEHTDERNE